MILSLSIPCNFRYHRTGGAHLWFFYKQIQVFRDRLDDVLFVGYEGNYVLPSSLPEDAWEKDPEVCRVRGYAVPEDELVCKARVRHVDPCLFAPLEEKFRSWNLVWKHLIQHEYPPYKEFLLRIVGGLAEKPETMILTCNDATAEAVAASQGIPVIHNEIGPTRTPDFIQTAYWDLHGVNGNTEAEARFLAWKEQGAAPRGPELSRRELLFLFAGDAYLDRLRRAPVKPDFPCGVAGQVEDDSNLIAYSNGFDNLELLKFAKYHFGSGNVLFRPHPSGQSLFTSHVDLSGNSGLFLARIGHLLTINSSMALEAALLDRPVTVFGGSPFRLLSGDLLGKRKTDPSAALNFLLLNYCIPFDWLFRSDYSRWRLSMPSEAEIRERHLAYYLKLRGYSSLEAFREFVRSVPPPESGAEKVLPPESVVSVTVSELPTLSGRLKRELAVYKEAYEFNRSDAQNYKEAYESAKTDAENYKRAYESAHDDAVNYKHSYEYLTQEVRNYREAYEYNERMHMEFKAKYEALLAEIERKNG